MADEKFSEKEVKLAQQRAFVAGVAFRNSFEATGSVAQKEAKKRYPLPKIRKPRIVSIPGHGEWSFIAAPRSDALLMYRSYPDSDWVNTHPAITPEIAAKLAPLFAEPLEEVEDPDDA